MGREPRNVSIRVSAAPRRGGRAGARREAPNEEPHRGGALHERQKEAIRFSRLIHFYIHLSSSRPCIIYSSKCSIACGRGALSFGVHQRSRRSARGARLRTVHYLIPSPDQCIVRRSIFSRFLRVPCCRFRCLQLARTLIGQTKADDERAE